jgi:IS30 family transposase
MPSGYPYSPAVRRELFDRVCRGAPLLRAARDMGVSTTRAWIWWRDAGAMQLIKGSGGGIVDPGNTALPGAPGHRLSLNERIEIMRGLDAGLSHAEIGRRIGRDRITIWREARRNRNPDGDYHARMAHARAALKAQRPKAFKLLDNPVCASIEAWMDDGWSPRLIAQMLARDHPDDRLTRVSHETIYKCLYVQTRGSLRADLHKCLSTKRTTRKSRAGIDNRRGAYSSGEEFRISDRPPEVADRAVPGHWEGDLIVGPTTVQSAPWSNAAPDSPSCCTCPATTVPTPWPPR